MSRPAPAPHPLGVLVFLVAVPLVLGCLAAPWVHRALPAIADWIPGLQGHGHDDFEKVANRCVQIFTLLLVWPCMRRSGTTHIIREGLRWQPARARVFLLGLLAGVLSMAALYVFGWFLGAYRLDPDNISPASYAGRIPFLLIGALLVGVLEEIFFRGFVFGSLRLRLPLAAALMLSAALFSVVHFIKPLPPAPIEQPAWWSGFALLPHTFAEFKPVKDWDFAATLFLMGLALAGFYTRHGHLYGIAGLHAGWVWALASADYVLDRKAGYLDFWFSRGDLLSRGTIAVPVILLFAWWALRPRRSPAPS